MPISELTDAVLVSQAQSGHEEALTTLMERYKRSVLNFVYRILGDATEAEDVAQETFVRLYRHLAAYNPRRPFSTWLFALARHAAIDRLRQRQRHPTVPLDAAPEPVAIPREVETRELGEQIAAAIQSLPEDQRTAIVLAEYHGLSHAAIAEVMRCSEKSVESRLYRARQALREKLARWLA